MAIGLQSVREFFSLRDLEQRAARIPDDRKTAAQRELQLAKQKHDAAETLWLADAPAEALRLATESFERTAAAFTALGDEGPGADAQKKQIDDGRKLLEAQAPTLDEEFTEKHAQLFRDVMAQTEALHGGLHPIAGGKGEILRRKVSRIAWTVGIVAALGVSAFYLLRTPRILKAEASASWDAKYEPSKAVDGIEKTEWLLPDRSPGWIEVQVIPARKLKLLKLMNAKNVPFNDRATHEFHVDAYDKGKVVKSADGKFDSFSAEKTYQVVQLDTHVEKIRIEVKSWHQSGGGFAEIEVE